MTDKSTMPRPLCRLCLGDNPKVRGPADNADLVCDACWKDSASSVDPAAMRTAVERAVRRVASDTAFICSGGTRTVEQCHECHGGGCQDCDWFGIA